MTITVNIYRDHFLIDPGDDPDDLFLVKKLPGREWSQDYQAWIIPIRPGATQAINETLGMEIDSERVKQVEADFLERLKPKPITISQAFDMSAELAISLAVTEHLYSVHHGDLEDYAYNHYPYRIGE